MAKAKETSAAVSSVRPDLTGGTLPEGVRKPPRPDLKDEELLMIPKYNPHYKFDEELLALVGQDIAEKLCPLLVGHKGVGKTSFFMQCAATFSKPVRRLNLNGQCTVADLVGYNTVIDGNIVWIDGALTQAMRRGQWCLLDELDSATPDILFVLNPVAEPDGYLTLKEKDSEIVFPHPDFRLMGTGNTLGCMDHYRHLYQGTNQMNDAFIDRFPLYEVGYMLEDDETDVLAAMTEIEMPIAKSLVQFANAMRQSFEQETLSRPMSMRGLLSLVRTMKRVHKLETEKARSRGTGSPIPTPNELILKAVRLSVVPKYPKADGDKIMDIAALILQEAD